ncbi:hypothetical protein BOX15_Mlig007190g1, partial [Macrostomum lignano]
SNGKQNSQQLSRQRVATAAAATQTDVGTVDDLRHLEELAELRLRLSVATDQLIRLRSAYCAFPGREDALDRWSRSVFLGIFHDDDEDLSSSSDTDSDGSGAESGGSSSADADGELFKPRRLRRVSVSSASRSRSRTNSSTYLATNIRTKTSHRSSSLCNRRQNSLASLITKLTAPLVWILSALVLWPAGVAWRRCRRLTAAATATRIRRPNALIGWRPRPLCCLLALLIGYAVCLHLVLAHCLLGFLADY